MFAVQMIVNVPSRIHVAHLREEFMEFCDSLNLDAFSNRSSPERQRRKSLKQRGVSEPGPTAAFGRVTGNEAPLARRAALFVLDTNVLMHDPTAIFRFEEQTCICPWWSRGARRAQEGRRKPRATCAR